MEVFWIPIGIDTLFKINVPCFFLYFIVATKMCKIIDVPHILFV